MRYLVTGCAGFIASRVCGLLLEQGDEVVGLDSLNDAYDVRLKHWRLAQLLGQRLEASSDYRLKIDARFPLKSEDGRFAFIKGDTGNKEDVRRAFGSGKFDAVLNLAARAGVPASFADPVGFHRSNTEGVANILEAMAKHGVKSHVLASTSSVYAPAPGAAPQRSKESDCTDYPRSPYAASKKAAELLCHSYAVRRDNPIDTTVVRYFTVYGPAGRPDMSIFRFIESGFRGTEIEVTSDGTQSRDFTYVDDCVEALLLAATHPGAIGGVFNLGGAGRITLRALAELVVAAAGGGRFVLRDFPADRRKIDIGDYVADDRLIRRILGWRPRIGIPEAVERTVDYYRAQLPYYL